MKKRIISALIACILLPTILFSCMSCKKDLFSDNLFMITYEYDGTKYSYSFSKGFFNLRPHPHLNIARRNDTTFFFAPDFSWSACDGYINVIDKENLTIPDHQTVYVLKEGVIGGEVSKYTFNTENIIHISDMDNKEIEIIEGWCSFEKVYRDNGASFKPRYEWRGVKLCFEVRWRDIESDEDHIIRNAEAYYSKGIIQEKSPTSN